VLGDGAEPWRAERRGQSPELPHPAPGQEGAERLQVGGRRGDQARRHRVEPEQVHVEVPSRRGQVAEPLELGGVLARQVGRQDIAEQLDRRPGTADGHAQVVQELGVDVAEHAIGVLLEGVQQTEQQAGDRDRGRHRGGDLGIHAA
jgi:hypothetical protein